MNDVDGWTTLHYAARYNDYELIESLIGMEIDIFLKTNDGKNCLHIAALFGHVNLCKILIDEHKFDPYMADHDGWAALHCAAQNGSYELITYFFDKVSNIHLRTNDGKNCLHIAAMYNHINLCELLVHKHNIDACTTDCNGWTALHCSARCGSYELITFFVDAGNDIHLTNNFGMNCLHIAALYGHFNLCDRLIDEDKFDVCLADNDGWTALHYYAGNGSNALVKHIDDHGWKLYFKDNDDWNYLHIAALGGHLNLCKTLTEGYNFDVHMSEIDGWTALHFSARSGSYELVKYLAARGGDIKLKTNNGHNCLHIAAFYGHLTLCKVLVKEHMFNPNVVDDRGWTALHFSAASGADDLFTYFAELPINVNLETDNGMNCLHIAAHHGHLNLCIKLLNQYEFNLHIADNDGWAAIHHASSSGSIKLVTLFIERGIDIHLKTKDDQNCLHIAARNGHLNLCKVFVDNYNFDVHLADIHGWTALHCSAENGRFDLFSYILSKGCEIYSKTNSAKNILHLAARNGHFDICVFVLEHFIKDFKHNNIKKQHTLSGRSYKSQIFYKYATIFLHAMDSDGNTYLHLAAEGNHSRICMLLLRYDTEIITLLNKKDETAREIAKNNGHKNVFNALKTKYEREGTFFYYYVLRKLMGKP